MKRGRWLRAPLALAMFATLTAAPTWSAAAAPSGPTVVPITTGESAGESAANSSESPSSDGADPSASTSPTPTGPPPACEQTPQSTPLIANQPWTMTTYGAPDRIWPYATGAGTTVAVIGTGVDATHTQLVGKVDQGYDVLRSVTEGNVDCAGQSTAVAGIIAAQRVNGIGFYGLAPDAVIYPVRVIAQPQITPPQSDKPLTAEVLAAGVTRAIAANPDVIVVADIVFIDDPSLAAAVQSAIAAGIVVVAPVGDAHPTNPPDSDSPSAAIPYPAAYPDVIGVGSVGQNGERAPTSEVGTFVDLVAPGENVIATGIGGHGEFKGTPFAAAYVAAAASLLLSEPGFVSSVSRAQRPAAVSQRLIATASPVSGYFGPLAYGAGLVDPFRALTEPLSTQPPITPTPYVEPVPDPAVVAAETETARDSATASSLGWIALGALLVTLCAAWFLQRAKRTGRRPVKAAYQDRREHDRELEFIPGERLFAPPEEPL